MWRVSPTFHGVPEPEVQHVKSTFSAEGLYVVQHPHFGRHVVTSRAFNEGEVVAVWRGYEISESEALALQPAQQEQLLQVGIGTFLVNDDPLCTADFINHSCEANCGFLDATTLAAMRRIEPGESITFDYAISDSNSFVAFECVCDSPVCRGSLRSDDWRLPDVQRRYAGWFAPHIQQLIDGATNASPATTNRPR